MRVAIVHHGGDWGFIHAWKMTDVTVLASWLNAKA
jgi:hypothetical protein